MTSRMQLRTQLRASPRPRRRTAFDAVIDCIADYLKKGDRVQIGGFGSFSVSERAARKGRNPATGASITIAASKNVRFKAASTLKDAVNKKRKK